jgi:hypothetical protein
MKMDVAIKSRVKKLHQKSRCAASFENTGVKRKSLPQIAGHCNWKVSLTMLSH